MSRGKLAKLVPLMLISAALVGVFALLLQANAIVLWEVWKREQPLKDAIAVTRVSGGALTLADGRVLRPAGVSRLPSVTPEDYDNALRAITAQGVIVSRQTSEATCLLLAEPKLYNWCGTHQGFTHWAGAYYRCPLSDLLMYAGYARADPDAPGLTPRERWRIEGLGELCTYKDQPMRVSSDGRSLRYDPTVGLLEDFDEFIAANWKPAPE